MFLGDLSSHTERKARKATDNKKSKNEDVVSNNQPLKLDSTTSSSSSTSESSTTVQSVGAILYSTDNPDIPRDIFYNFFVTVSNMLAEEQHMESMVNKSIKTGVGLEKISVLFQTDVMEKLFQIEKKYGCKYMVTIPDIYAQDEEMLNAARDFTYATIKCYVNMLNLRFRKNGSKLRRTGGLSKTQLNEFFEGCNATMSLHETKAELKALFESTGKPPNQRVIDKQHHVLELIGVEHTYGVSCLNNIPRDYPTDQELQVKMQQFALRATFACKEATLSPDQVKEVYSEIPLLMTYFPHVYHYQKQMLEMQQRQMLANNQTGMMMDDRGGGSGASGVSREEMMQKQQQMQTYFSSSEGMNKIKELSARVECSKKRAEASLTDWDVEKRKNYFESFMDHPVLEEINSSEGNSGGAVTDPVVKINKFLSLSETDLDDLLKMQLIISQDIQSGGTLMKQMASTGDGRGKGMMGDMYALRSMTSGLMNMSGGSSGGGGGSSSSGSGGAHVHQPGCQHYNNNGSGSKAPDVATGKGDVMDR